MLTAEELRKMLDYAPDTGVFTWRVSPNNFISLGQEAGRVHVSGYVHIQARRRMYKAHRLAWLYVHGCWPIKDLDHINGVKHDNRISNLREATRSENISNAKKRCDSFTKYKGVAKDRGRFRALIVVKGRRIYLGCYATEKEAHAAYMAAAEKEFGAFARAE
jgi:hypothetical protein